MQYSYKAIKNVDISDEKFESAFYCSVTSVESILSDYEVEVVSKMPYIYISPKADSGDMPFSIQRCNEVIQVAFVDANGRTYPEFKSIKPTEA